MVENLLYCAGCNVQFKAKSYDPKRTYNCPKCDQPLEAEGEADTSADGVSLNTQGQIQTDKKKDPLVGRKIAQYKIVRKLGQGGMGSVYEAKHLELGRPVALKLLSPKLAEEDPDAVERFKREARAAAILNHPNVVIVYSVGSEGPHHFIELEYVDGESLQERVRREKRLTVAEASRITMDAAKGLGAAHRQNFVHRDIKPGNIMLTKDDQVKVMDFGLAKDVTASAQLTMSGQIMGTPHYMSPEQCDGETLDGRSDIYSLGATYYAMLAGRTPYQGSSLLSILRQQADAPVPDVREKCPELSEGVQRVIEKAMAKRREDRFQTMEELAAALAQAQSAPGGGVPDGAAATAGGADAGGADAAGAALGDMIDADEEREHHLHTARIRGRIKEVEAFLGVWKELAKAAAAGRKKGKVDDEAEAVFGRLRDTIRKQYAGILKRLGNPGAPGQRVTSACDTGITLTSVAQMPDADYRDLMAHFQMGAKLLYDYQAFLEEGRQDLLKQSTLYYYWDKIMHNRVAGGIAGTAAVLLLCLVGWQVVKHLPKGKATPVVRDEPEPAAEQTPASTDRPTEREQQAGELPTPSATPKLPPGFERAFEIPTTDKDQHGNPVVTRAGSRSDPATGWPYEVWLKEPKMEFVLVPAGELMMGTPEDEIEKARKAPEPAYARGEEGPQHRVRISKPFYLGKYEALVTAAQFRQIVDAEVCAIDGGAWLNPGQQPTDRTPTVCAKWVEVAAFCQELTKRCGVTVALPTEAQWEYACRAGARGQFQYEDDPDGTRLSEYAWYEDNSGKKPCPVGRKKPNSLGLYDMIGNVWEWCADWYDGKYYGKSPGTNPPGPSTGSTRVLRGGSWRNPHHYMRAAYRGQLAPTARDSNIGFRCVAIPSSSP